MDKQKSIPANRIPLSHRLRKLKDSLYLRTGKPHTEEASEIEEHSVEHEGNIVGNVVTKDGEVVEHHASADMQESGQDEKVASKVGGKSFKPVKTVASRAAEQAADTVPMKPKEAKGQPTSNGDRDAEKVELKAPESKSTSQEKAFKEGKADQSLFKPAKGKSGGMKPEEGDFKAEKKSGFDINDSQSAGGKKEGSKGSKPDKSMSKMASQKSADIQGSELFKSNDLRKDYKIDARPGAIKYEKKNAPKGDESPVIDYSKHPAPPEPKVPAWKKKWDAKTPEERKAFASQLHSQRLRQGAVDSEANLKKKPGLGKSFEDKYKIANQADDVNKSQTPGWRRCFECLKKNSMNGYPEMGIEGAAATPPEPTMEKAAPSMQAPGAPKPGQSKIDEKKQQLLQLARMGKARPLTSTPLGHAFANYTDPNSFSYDAKFAAQIQRMAPQWTKK